MGEGKKMDEATLELGCATPNLTRVEAQTVTKTDGSKAIARRAQHYTQELAVVAPGLRLHRALTAP
jgi:hypothetical protein